jgi:hypothetical protein
MLPVGHFRVKLVRYSLVLIGLSAVGAVLLWDTVIALSILLGGFAGVFAFWLLARRVESFKGMDATQIQLAAMRGMFVRLAIYGAALTAAWMLDPGNRMTLAAGIYGLLVPRVVMYALAFTSLRRSVPSE